jgi:molybdopterin synthase catalytic subunit
MNHVMAAVTDCPLNAEAAARAASADPRLVMATVTDQELDPAAMEALVAAPEAGAVICFIGTVRNHDSARAVTSLDYEAHPDAAERLSEIAGQWLAAHPTVARAAVAHRTGRLDIGHVAFVAVVAAPHRREAFAACAALVDAVKAELPVWKCQHFTGGPAEWVNSP